MPECVKQNGTTQATYVYLADGTKAEVYTGSTQSTGTGYTYLGSLRYTKNGNTRQLESTPFGAGRFVNNTGGMQPYYHITDHLGSVRVITDRNGTVQEQNDYYPYGGRHTSGNTYAALPGNNHKFNGKEEQTTGNLRYLDYGARMYDNVTGRWETPDPLAEKYNSMSPYNYCLNNPVMFVDPDGREVVARTKEAQQVILNTIPKELRNVISFKTDGSIDRESFQNVTSKSENFNSLKTMTLSDKVIEVTIADKFIYMDNNGHLGSREMSYLGVEELFIGNDNGKGIGTSTGETGFLGKTLFPDRSGKENSPDNQIKIVINSGLSNKGKAETYSHEANGHAYLYITTGNREAASHQYAPGNKDNNRKLFERINRSINETINNMK